MAQVSNYTALISGSSWSVDGAANHSAFVTYSFDTTVASYLTGYQSVQFANSFEAFDDSDKAMTIEALRQWEVASGIKFIEAPDGQGDIRFGLYNFNLDADLRDFGGFAYYPTIDITVDGAGGWANAYVSDIGGDVFINSTIDNSVYLMLHEIGHAIGLKHPFDDDPVLNPGLDDHSNTVMSYTGNYPDLLGPFDKQAINVIYGFDDAANLLGYSWDFDTYTLTQFDGDDGDILPGTSVHDVIVAGDGNDQIAGYAGNDTLYGDAGDDVLVGGAGSDILSGGAGNDLVYGGDGINELGNSDTASFAETTQGVTASVEAFFSAAAGKWINAAGTESGYDVLNDISNLIGGSGDDTLTGDITDNTLTGNGGADVIVGDDGNDTLFGGDGIDDLSAGAGNDTLVGNEYLFTQDADTLDAGAGDDRIYGEWTDVISGGDGFDILYAVNSYDWSLALAALSVEMFFADFGNDTIDATGLTMGAEVFASGGNDTLTGSGLDDRLWAGVGDDVVEGSEGNDMLFGDDGADQLSGGDGNDVIYADDQDTVIHGGDGFDVAYIATGSGAVIDMALSSLDYLSDLAGGNDDFDASGLVTAAEIYAGGGNDTVSGGSANDFLWGMNGDDRMTGGLGNDVLVGGAGIDIIDAGAGDDRVYLGSGSGSDGSVDTLVLAAGWGHDRVYDFTHGVDKIDMSALGTSFAALTVTSLSGAAIVTLGADELMINGAAGTLDANDFIF